MMNYFIMKCTFHNLYNCFFLLSIKKYKIELIYIDLKKKYIYSYAATRHIMKFYNVMGFITITRVKNGPIRKKELRKILRKFATQQKE